MDKQPLFFNYQPGDMIAHEDESGDIVVWTRGGDGIWRTSDGRGPDTLALAEKGNWIYARGGLLLDFMDEAVRRAGGDSG